MNRVVSRKKKRKTINLKKVFFLFFVIAIIVYGVYYYNLNGNLGVVETTISQAKEKISEIKGIDFGMISYASSNENVEEEVDGQHTVSGEDGYTTTFTVTTDENKKTYLEYKQNTPSSWNEEPYWGGTMAENGCGITSIAIVASGYGSGVTPGDLREKYYPHLDGDKMQEAFEDLGIETTDFCYHGSYTSKSYISDWLRSGRPIVICVDNQKDNKWTKSSHYMVLLGIDDNGKVYVSNPNGKDGSKKASGWYGLKDISPYIVKAMFIESY